MAVVDYYFTLVSPWTFLGDAAFRDIAQKHGATIRHIPVNMGRVFQATGGLPLAKRSDAGIEALACLSRLRLEP